MDGQGVTLILESPWGMAFVTVFLYPCLHLTQPCDHYEPG